MLEVNNVSLKLDNKEILSNINMKINKGKIYGLIGPNGVGKTSLIKCLTGIYKTSSGEILYDGENVYDSSRVKGKIAYVADENNFFSSFTIKEILKYYSLAYKDFDIDKFRELNKDYTISEKKKYRQLSKGMKMRICILLAMCQNAEYFILDEPTAGLDPLQKNRLLKLLQEEVIEKGITIIISSHHLSELERICDDVILLDRGRVSYENSLENMKNKIKKIQVAFDCPVYEEDINVKGIISISLVGRVFTIITENYGEEFLTFINDLNPLFLEEIELTLEDIFIYKVQQEDENEKVI